ncbi:MAG: hypothetical protein KIH63_002795 [Candidatus Saccharibacteria bacterium]|nr:hypothetical protein [Candidatus Saccharibacteria bacterium]
MNSLARSNEGIRELAIYGGLLLLGLVGVRGCAEAAEEPRDKVITFVEDAGYNGAVITDIDKAPFIWGCGERDTVKYEISAVSANTGRDVSFDVCDGLLKGMTIRD